jgi:Outer membrane protein beta-barrel family
VKLKSYHLNLFYQKTSLSILLLLNLAISGIHAQTKIDGIVFTRNYETIPACTVNVYENGKGKQVFTCQSDSAGHFSLTLPDLSATWFNLSVSHVGYIRFDTSFSSKQIGQFKILLRDSIKGLEAVTVTAKNSLFERKGDKFIFNVSALKAEKPINAWELLNSTPFVHTDDQGSIKVINVTGVKVLIDGRPVTLSGDALMNYLKSLSSEVVDRIEVITNPSSKYSAEGGAGIVNILKKKNLSEGLKGSATLSVRKATSFSPFTALNIQFRKHKSSFFLDGNSNNQNLRFNSSIDLISFNGILPTYESNNQTTRKLKGNLQSNVSAGWDYEIGARTVVGLSGNFSSNTLKRDNLSTSIFRKPALIITDSLKTTRSKNEERSNLLNSNFHFDHVFDTLGTSLNFNVDLLFYGENRGTQQQTVSDIAGPTIAAFINKVPLNVKNRTVSLDYTFKPRQAISFSSGARFSYSSTKNDIQFWNLKADSIIVDTSKSSLFSYQERIFAVYANLAGRLAPSLDFQFGLRNEISQIRDNRAASIFKLSKSYNSLLPTLFLNYNISSGTTASYSVTSRINRPSFWDLNPFRYYNSDAIYLEGNPSLTLSKIFKHEVSVTLKGNYIFLSNYVKTVNNFSTLNYFDGQNLVIKKYNYGKSSAFGFGAIGNRSINKRMNVRYSLIGTLLHFEGSYQNVIIDKKTLNVNLDLSTNYIVSKRLKLYSTIALSNNFPHYSENTFVRNQLRAQFYARKVMADGKAILSLIISDVLRSSKDRYQTLLQGVQLNESYYYDSKAISISFTYQFGTKKKTPTKAFKAANNDVQERLK